MAAKMDVSHCLSNYSQHFVQQPYISWSMEGSYRGLSSSELLLFPVLNIIMSTVPSPFLQFWTGKKLNIEKKK